MTRSPGPSRSPNPSSHSLTSVTGGDKQPTTSRLIPCVTPYLHAVMSWKTPLKLVASAPRPPGKDARKSGPQFLPGEVASYVDQPSNYDFSFVLNVHNYAEDAGRCIYSILKNKNGYSVEIVVVDNGSTNGTADMLEDLRSHGSEIRVLHCDHALGDAAGKNIGLRLSLGRNVVILDTSVEVVGDILSPIKRQLSDATVGIFGPYGLTTQDMRHFHEDVSRGDVDAVQGYCMAFRREALKSVGLLREGFRFYRNLDIDHSFQFKDKGYRIVVDNTLPVVRHEHRQWAELDENQREELSRRNYRRFFKRWGRRPELLVASRTGLAGSPTPH